MRAKLKAKHPIEGEGPQLAHALQLYACTFRRAIRKAVARIVADLSSDMRGDEDQALPAGAACAAAAAVADLLSSASKATQALEHVRPKKTTTFSMHIELTQDVALTWGGALRYGRVTLLQVCGKREREALPAWLQREWALADEQVLLEARVSLLKLVARMDARCPPHQLSCSRRQEDGPAVQHPDPVPLQQQASLEGLAAEVQQLQERVTSCAQLAILSHPARMPAQHGSEPACTGVGGMTESAAAGPLSAEGALEPGSGAGMAAIQERHERDAQARHGRATTTSGQDVPDQAGGGEQGPDAGQGWLLSPESMHSIGRGGASSLVFVNPRALLSALGRHASQAPFLASWVLF